MSQKTLYSTFYERATSTPSAVAMVAGDRELTYGDLLDATSRFAGHLRTRGIGPGDRVLVFSENCPEFLVALFACAQRGAVLTTVYPSFGPDEISYIVDHSDPAIALVHPNQLRVFDEVIRSRPAGLVVDDLVRGVADSADHETADLSQPEQATLICYTSGTTSRPKAVVHAGSRLVNAAAMHIAMWHIEPGDRLLLMTPMAWLFGLVTTAVTGLLAGATLIDMPYFNPVRAVRLIDEQSVTVTMGVGTMYAKLADVSETTGRAHGRSSLRLCLGGGEARNEGTLNDFRRHFGVPIHDIYAASECFPIITSDPRVDPEPHPTASGRVALGATVRIVDAGGADVAPGEIGELVARSAASMLGYFRPDDSVSAVVDADGWFHSKDLARIDAEGLVFIVGRTSDMIIRGGANVSPAEVERVLASHPGIHEVAVVGAADAVYGQRVVAFVVRADRAVVESDVIAHAAAHLAKYKVPAHVEFVEDLPRTTNGKVKRSALYDQESSIA